MTDPERWALNREIAEGLGWKQIAPYWQSRPSALWGIHPTETTRQPIPDFAGDMNAALDMGERLREMGLWREYLDHIPPSTASSDTYDMIWTFLQVPASVRAQAAAEVLRERGGK